MKICLNDLLAIILNLYCFLILIIPLLQPRFDDADQVLLVTKLLSELILRPNQ